MQLELLASKVCSSHVFADGTNSSGSTCSLSKSYSDLRVKRSLNRVEYRKLRSTLLGIRLSFFADGRIPTRYDLARSHIVPCATRSSETKECSRQSEGAVNISRGRVDEGDAENALAMNTRKIKVGSSSRKLTVGLADACNFVHNDAKFMNERAKNDIVLLSRGITRLNDRARQDAAVIGNEFRKLDARARKDTEKIDTNVKKRAARLRHIAINLKDRAQSKLKTVADEHWSDGALEADLRRADIIVRRRAMEDAYMALKFVKDIHDMMVNKQLPKDEGSLSVGNQMGYITLERNGKASDLFPGDISMDRITAIQEAYWSMASALSEADGIDYTDPEELELLVATLIDLDAMDGKSSVSLLAECSISPDVNTRKALANALASAPSMWTLGNAGMGALQRLAEDSNSAVATAAANAIDELRRQWEIQEGDSFTFVMNQARLSEDSNKVPFDDDC